MSTSICDQILSEGAHPGPRNRFNGAAGQATRHRAAAGVVALRGVAKHIGCRHRLRDGDGDLPHRHVGRHRVLFPAADRLNREICRSPLLCQRPSLIYMAALKSPSWTGSRRYCMDRARQHTRTCLRVCEFREWNLNTQSTHQVKTAYQNQIPGAAHTQALCGRIALAHQVATHIKMNPGHSQH